MKLYVKYFRLGKGLIALLVMVSSCANLYVPPTSNTPLISEEGEGNIDVGVTTSSFYAMGAYGVTEKIAIIGDASISYGDFGWADDLDNMVTSSANSFWGDPNYRHSSANIGLGRFWKLGRTDFVVEAYAGAGGGMSGFTNDVVKDIFESDYFSGFGQVNWGYKNSAVELGMMLKCTGSMFTTYYSQLSDEYLANHLDVGSTSTQFPLFMWQYGFTGRFGRGRLKFVNSISFNAMRAYRPQGLQNIHLGLPESTPYGYGTFHNLKYPRASFAVGISYRFK